MKKIFTLAPVLLTLVTLNIPIAQASENMPEKMTCLEFINLNPKAMLPVAWWMLNEKTVYKGGDSVSLNESELTSIPQVLEYCKRNPKMKLYSFKDQQNQKE